MLLEEIFGIRFRLHLVKFYYDNISTLRYAKLDEKLWMALYEILETRYRHVFYSFEELFLNNNKTLDKKENS